MKHVPALLAALLLLAFAPSTRTPESIVQITWTDRNEDGAVVTHTCTGFVINLASVLTAEHCVPPADTNNEVLVDGKAARILKRSTSLILLSYEPYWGKLPLMLASSPKVGEQVWVWGHAYSGPLMVLGRHVAGYADDHLIVDGPIAPGMSGGPIVNEAGKVVGITQATQNAAGIACTSDEIKEFLK